MSKGLLGVICGVVFGVRLGQACDSAILRFSEYSRSTNSLANVPVPTKFRIEASKNRDLKKERKVMMSRILFLAVCVGLFATISAAQEDVSNNEIEGLQFSTQEKVRDLSLLVSSKEDVMAIFGKDCLHGCRFNDDWDISFSFVGSGWSYTKMENGREVVYKPNPAVVDKLADIGFKPRRAIMLPKKTFGTSGLKCSDGVTSRGGIEFKSIICTDHRSLTYFIYGETDPVGKYKKDQIFYITYSTIPTDKIYTHASDAVVSH